MKNNRPIYILGTGLVSPNGIQKQALSEKTPTSPLSDVSALADYIPKRKLRRIDHFSRLALYASCLALDDAGVWGKDIENTGIALTSGYGAAHTTFNFLDSFLDDGDRLASPTHFSNGLHNAASAYISMHTKTHGPSSCSSNIGIGTAYSLQTAIYWLQKGIVDYALVGGVDEYCQVLEHCVTRFKSSNEGKCLTSSCIAGEGAAFMVLGTNPSTTHSTECKVTVPEIGQYPPRQAMNFPQKLFTAPIGLVQQEPIYDDITKSYDAQSTLSKIGSHPSALAFASVQAAQTVLKGEAPQSGAFALDQLNKYALITFTS